MKPILVGLGLVAGGALLFTGVGAIADALIGGAAEGGQITILGSLNDTAVFTENPELFNVFAPSSADLSADELAAENAQWLSEAMNSGNPIWLVTNPVAHAEFIESLGTSSYYLNLELPMLEQAGVTGIPMY